MMVGCDSGPADEEMRAFLPEPPEGMEWQLVPELSDESSGRRLDEDKWQAEHPYWEGREPSRFDPENVSARNGTLRLRSVSLVDDLSDVVTFHSYFGIDATKRLVAVLEQTGRPLLCTEYLARGSGCSLEEYLPYFREDKIGCYNWGLVSGKTQTMYSWEDHYPSGEEPPAWFHDLLGPDGRPYRTEEADLIRALTSS
jgi:hypothetical protein